MLFQLIFYIKPFCLLKEMKINVPVFRVYQLNKNGENVMIDQFYSRSEAEKCTKQMEVVAKFNRNKCCRFIDGISNDESIVNLFDDNNDCFIIIMLEDSQKEQKFGSRL